MSKRLSIELSVAETENLTAKVCNAWMNENPDIDSKDRVLISRLWQKDHLRLVINSDSLKRT